MAARKKRARVSPPPCAHVETVMVAYLAGLCVGPDAGDHAAVMWCVDCGSLVHKRYVRGGAVEDTVRRPRSSGL